METTNLILTLPKEDVEFAERYARAHHLSVTELIDQHLRSLREQERSIHPAVARVSGVISEGPAEDPRSEYHERLLTKHR